MLLRLTALLSLHILPTLQDTTTFSEATLSTFDGTGATASIYLAINGTVYDVSASPNFYGPGGAYHHFTGRDASRAWVSQCWATEDQLTWRMEGVEKMFVPKYLDERLENVVAGEDDVEEGEFVPEQLAGAAEKLLARVGPVGQEEKARRREEDAREAEGKVEEALKQWVDFFAGNEKYPVVGTVIYDVDKSKPPKLCPEALKKRPLKNGKLEGLLSMLADGGVKVGVEETEAVPDFVKTKTQQTVSANEPEKQTDENVAAKDEL